MRIWNAQSGRGIDQQPLEGVEVLHNSRQRHENYGVSGYLVSWTAYYLQAL
jgi:hypothetical protein